MTFDLYTIQENSSEENTHRSEPPPVPEINLLDIIEENNQDELISGVEKQTDLILRDIQKEEMQLNEIINDIDKLFQNDERIEKEQVSVKKPDKSKSDLDIQVRSLLDQNENKIKNVFIDVVPILEGKESNSDHLATFGDIVNILEELDKPHSLSSMYKKIYKQR